jgi:hypothetical protein
VTWPGIDLGPPRWEAGLSYGTASSSCHLITKKTTFKFLVNSSRDVLTTETRSAFPSFSLPRSLTLLDFCGRQVRPFARLGPSTHTHGRTQVKMKICFDTRTARHGTGYQYIATIDKCILRSRPSFVQISSTYSAELQCESKQREANTRQWYYTGFVSGAVPLWYHTMRHNTTAKR